MRQEFSGEVSLLSNWYNISPMKERFEGVRKELFGRLAGPAAEYLLSERLLPFYRQLYEGNIEQSTLDFLHAKHEKGYTTFVYANHTSHIDSIALSFVAEPICQRLQLSSLLAPGAVSMEGAQGKAIKEFFSKAATLLDNHHIEYVPVARPKDREKYGIEFDNKRQLNLMLHARTNNRGIAMTPEGTVTGGRLNPLTNSIYGLQEPDKETMRLISLIAKYNKVVFLPVGIVGSQTIFSADGLFPTPELLRELFKYESRMNNVHQLAQLNVGVPFTTDDLVEVNIDTQNSQELTTYLMEKLVDLTPPKFHGAYAK